MKDKKICPFRNKGVLVQGSETTFNFCLLDKCALFDENLKKCALTVSCLAKAKQIILQIKE